MAVQIGVPRFNSGPHLAPPVHPFYPPPTVLPAPDHGTQHHQAASANVTVKTSAMSTAPSGTGAAGGNAANQAPGQTSGSSFDGRRMRSKLAIRRTVDYNCSVANWIQSRVWQRDQRDMRAIQPEAIYSPMMVLPAMLLENPVNGLATRSVRVAMNKVKCPIFCTCWTPEGRRLVTGASSGEFTLWNGLTFSFETILQAHDTSVRAMIWSHNDTWMLTADHGGYVKYWQSNMNNVKMYQAHKDPIRGLSFCPLDQKFASCSDDGTVRIWDFLRCQEERILRGHGADVKCVDWHPLKGLIVSGSKDTQQPVKLWDPRTGASLSTIHAHKHTVMDLKWNRNGNWLLTASRDHLLKIFDIRNLKEELQSFRGHKKEATTLAWHPVHECLFASGGSDGAIMFWLVGNEKELGSIDEAHETMVWSMSWHPLGHILVSGSNDHTTKFWTRNRPGDLMKDRYNLNTLPAGMAEEVDYECDNTNQTVVPGLGHEFVSDVSSKADQDTDELNSGPAIPGLDLSPEKRSAMSDAVTRGLSAADSRWMRKKAIYTKPVPKDFERAWTEGRQPSAVASSRETIPDDRPSPDSAGGPPHFDDRGAPSFEMSHGPYKWQGPMRHPNPEGPMNPRDQPNPLLPNPELLHPHFPGQGFAMGGPQGPHGGPRGPMQGSSVRGPMGSPGPPGPHNPMMNRMPNPMQPTQQQGMMPPPPRPPLMNQSMRGPTGPPGPGGPQGPRPLLSLPFQDRDMSSAGGHPGSGAGRGGVQSFLFDTDEDQIHRPHPSGAHFANAPGEDANVYREAPDGEFGEIRDHNGQFDNRHIGDIDYRAAGNTFGPDYNAALEFGQDPFPAMGHDVNARGNWRRPRGGGQGMHPHPGPPGGRNFGPPNTEHFTGQGKPPSLLDMKIVPAPSSSMGMKRKWEDGPPADDENPEFMMPHSIDNRIPGPFDVNPEMPREDADNWPPEGPRPQNGGRGRGNFFRGRGLPRGRGMRGGGRGR